MLPKTLFFALSFVLFVVATTTTIREHLANPSPVSSADCNHLGYHPVCCVGYFNEISPPASSLILGLLTIVVDLGVQLIGIDCAPISGGVCDGNVLCCEYNNFGTVVNIGCLNIVI